MNELGPGFPTCGLQTSSLTIWELVRNVCLGGGPPTESTESKIWWYQSCNCFKKFSDDSNVKQFDNGIGKYNGIIAWIKNLLGVG